MIIGQPPPGLWLPAKPAIIRAQEVPSSDDVRSMAFAPGFRGKSSNYKAKAVTFDGSTSFLSRASSFTGAVDGTDGTLSFWVKFNGGDGAEQYIFSSQSSRTRLLRQAAGHINCAMISSGGTIRTQVTTAGSVTADGFWHHIIWSWTCVSGGMNYFYLDGVQDQPGGTSVGNGTIDYTDATYALGARRTSNDEKLNASMADFYFDQTFNDISVSANLQKFRTAAGKPANLGADGSLPTSAKPLIYLPGPAASFGTNAGSGGDYTVNGTFADAATSPSD